MASAIKFDLLRPVDIMTLCRCFLTFKCEISYVYIYLSNYNEFEFVFVFVIFIFFLFLKVLAMETAHRVSYCPRDEKEWQKASKRLNCSDDVTSPKNRYHCLPIDNLSTLHEFCYNRTRAQVIKGTPTLLLKSKQYNSVLKQKCIYRQYMYSGSFLSVFQNSLQKVTICIVLKHSYSNIVLFNRPYKILF